jgi:signal peptidase I
MKILTLLVMLLFSGAKEELGYKHYVAEGPSMAPTIQSEDRLTVDPDYYEEHALQRGDIIIFNAPSGNLYIKRVVALPKDNVKLMDNALYVNDAVQEEPYIYDEVMKYKLEYRKFNDDYQETLVPENAVFVLGDNRINSLDSRILGSIPKDKIIGKVIKIRHQD